MDLEHSDTFVDNLYHPNKLSISLYVSALSCHRIFMADPAKMALPQYEHWLTFFGSGCRKMISENTQGNFQPPFLGYVYTMIRLLRP